MARRVNPLLTDALRYANRDWPVHPLDGKRAIIKGWPEIATTDEGQLRSWWTDYPDANIGVIGGLRSGIFVIDFDGVLGRETLRALEETLGPLPPTLVAETPHGFHLYFRHPEVTLGNTVCKLGPGVDTRGEGGYVVAPRSVVDGRSYRWNTEIDPAQLPDAWVEALLRPKSHEIVSEIHEGQRDNELFKIAASLRGRGVSRDAAVETLRDLNKALCTPPLADRQVLKIVRSVWERYDPNGGELDLVLASDVAPEAVEALWPGRFFLKKINLLAGLPGLGKTTITLDIIARTTVGAEWPDGSGKAPKGDVVLMTTEDDIADTIRPRLEVMGADLTKVHVVRGVREEGRVKLFSLARHLGLLDATLERIGKSVRCVVLDPITGYFGGTDTHKTADVREVLAMIKPIAENRHAAFIAITHPNKSSNSAAAYRITGSLAFTAGARTVWLVGRDDKNPENLILAQLKNNLGPDPGALAYQVVGLNHAATKSMVAAIKWLGFTEAHIESLLDGSSSRRRGVEERTEITAEWLREVLAEGPVEVTRVNELARDKGFSDRALRRAREVLKVTTKPGRKGGPWVWSLPLEDET
jgi:hypothetical protein